MRNQDASGRNVHDRFHVAERLNEAVDKVRRTDIASFGGRRRDPEGQQIPFSLRAGKPRPQTRARLRELLNSDIRVGRAWTLKEQFRHFWERANARTALSFFSSAMPVQCTLGSSQ